MLFFGRYHTNVDMNEFIKEPSEHSHVPDPNRLYVIRLKNEIKIRGAPSNEGASTILSDVLRTTPLAVTAGLPSTEALLQTFVANENQYNLIIMVVYFLCCEKLIVVKISFSMKMIQ